jgi:hypothetical protein
MATIKSDLRVRAETTPRHMTGFTPNLELIATLAHWDGWHLRGLDSYEEAGYEHLGVYGFQGLDDEGRWLGLNPEYRDVYAIDMRRAETMTRTLRRAVNGMSRLTDRYGYPTGDHACSLWLTYFAESLGIRDHFPFVVHDPTHPGALRDGWRNVDRAGFDDWLNRRVEAWRKDNR